MTICGFTSFNITRWMRNEAIFCTMALFFFWTLLVVARLGIRGVSNGIWGGTSWTGGVWEFADLECPWSNVSVTGFIFLTIHILCSQPHPLNSIKALKHPIYLFLFHIHITTPQIHLHLLNNHQLFIITLVSGSTYTIHLLPLHSYSIPAHWHFCNFLYFWSLYHSTQIFKYVYMK